MAFVLPLFALISPSFGASGGLFSMIMAFHGNLHIYFSDITEKYSDIFSTVNGFTKIMIGLYYM